LFGYNSLGWRFASLCLGIFNLLLAFWLGRATWGSARAGLFAAACLAADGFFIAYSRAGLLDGMLACFVMWSFLAAVTARSGLGVISSAVLVGCAVSIKWSGALAVVPAAAAIWFLRRAPRYAVLAFILVPLVHAALWMGALALSGQPWDLESLWRLMAKLYRAHLARANEDNKLASAWWTWPLLYHPIVVKLSSVGVSQRYASSAGNVVFFAAGTLSMLAAPITPVLLRFAPRWRLRIPEWIDRPFLTRALLLSLGWFALMFPWMVARGKFTFWYHYLPSYGFALMLVAGTLAALEQTRQRLVLAVFGVALLVAVYYAPVWGEFTISVGTANMRLIPNPWKP
jgi:dolichyl-phosphate-mannose--protein O-mannosyl transferase